MKTRFKIEKLIQRGIKELYDSLLLQAKTEDNPLFRAYAIEFVKAHRTMWINQQDGR